MEDKSQQKMKILFTGDPAGGLVTALKEVGDVTLGSEARGLDQADVLWVDPTAAASPPPPPPLYRTALDAGKAVVLTNLDATTRRAVEGELPIHLGETLSSVMISRDTAASTPHSFVITVLEENGGVQSHGFERVSGGPRDTQAASPGVKEWAHGLASAVQARRQRTSFAVGGPGLIPPVGVKYGMVTLERSYTHTIGPIGWAGTGNAVQRPEFGFTTTYYIYRENGNSSRTDYTVIRVQQATFNPKTLLVRSNDAKGFWQYQLETGCKHNQSAGLLGTHPPTLERTNVMTQLSVPLYVKYLLNGGCVSTTWTAKHESDTWSLQGWGVMNKSLMSSGEAQWVSNQRDIWDSVSKPTSQFGTWWAEMFEGGYGGRVKEQTSLAQSLFTINNACAWRFSSNVGTVNFTEFIKVTLAAFANPKGSGNGHHIVDGSSNSQYPTQFIDLANVTNIDTPCS